MPLELGDVLLQLASTGVVFVMGYGAFRLAQRKAPYENNALGASARKDDAEAEGVILENYNKVTEKLALTTDKVQTMRERQMDTTEKMLHQAAKLRSMDRTIKRLNRTVETLQSDLLNVTRASSVWQKLAEVRLVKIDGMPDEIDALRTGLRVTASKSLDPAAAAEVEAVISAAAALSAGTRAAPGEPPTPEPP